MMHAPVAAGRPPLTLAAARSSFDDVESYLHRRASAEATGPRELGASCDENPACAANTAEAP